ncbi:MAG: UDP-N-acetylmuramoyl-L-alanine--D-glutamate ligase, partial [Synergistaceae bacterium]|nr:UDP-N-acetylmuramoyl-L-alanine--D-glutamate ligase [Synergistaceae bacterium]
IKQEVCAHFDELGIRYEMRGNTEKLLNADEIVVGSGIPPKNEILAEALERGMNVIGELDFVAPYLDGKIIGITGSNGKTTTTSMTGYFFEKLGRNVITCGNIGVPVAKAAGRKYDFIVMELSSFQLYWVKEFMCDIAVVTNLAPDHIDWHGSYENYVESKANLIRFMNPNGTAIYQKCDEEKLGAKCRNILPLSWSSPETNFGGLYMDKSGSAAWVSAGNGAAPSKLFDFDDVRLLGTHNLENTAMSTAVLKCCGEDVSAEMIASYVPPKHRCAFAGKVNSITFVDDSKGTNVAASVTAMSSLPNKKVMILGGQGKGEEYGPLTDAVKKYAKYAVIIGTEKEKIAASLKEGGFEAYELLSTMDEAVRTAYAKAAPGDTVLLSPACTSWDMYPNYGARGDDFCRVAREIIKEEEK